MSLGGADSESHNDKSSLLLFFQERRLFLSEEKKQMTFILCANLTVRFRSEACCKWLANTKSL
jgi:hypothetical protein